MGWKFNKQKACLKTKPHKSLYPKTTSVFKSACGLLHFFTPTIQYFYTDISAICDISQLCLPPDCFVIVLNIFVIFKDSGESRLLLFLFLSEEVKDHEKLRQFHRLST